MFLLGPVLLTATARAIRKIDYGDVVPRADEVEDTET
jgi:hypothetical protein